MSRLDYFNRQEMVTGHETGEKIKKTSILVIGVGAGGNELLKNLLLMGFGHFTIVDFDYIEDSNLSRTTLFRKEDIGKSKALVAAERLTELSLHENPIIKGIHGNIIYDVGPGIFIRHDFVVCCVDTLKARAYINDWCVRLNKPFFEMGFENMNVDISFFVPAEENSPCLREIIGQGDFSDMRNSCSGLKMQDVQLSHIPTIQVASAMAGVLVATEIIKYLQGKSSLQNKILQYYGMQQRMNVFDIDRSSQCLLHSEPPFEYKKIPVDNRITVEDFLQFVNAELHDYFMLSLPERFVLNGFCEGCNKEIVFNKYFSVIFDRQRWCSDCQDLKDCNYPGRWKIISELHLKMKDQSLLQKKLSELGVAPMALLNLKGISTEHVNYCNVLLD
jgi:adenylyltransferase/sulfurtransferase